MPTRYVLWDVLFVIIYFARFLVFANPPYSIYTLEQDRVCGLRYAKALTLGRDEKSAIIVKETRYFSELSGQYTFECSFVVKVAYNFGIFAVIQKMNLRKDEEEDKCIDYVQFCRFKANPIEKVSEKYLVSCKEPIGIYCGLASEVYNDSEDILAPNGIQDLTGEIGVKIHLGKGKLYKNETLEIEIAFTAFSSCSRDMGTYKMCSSSPDVVTGTCIYKEYFNDGIINCPYKGCADECGGIKDLESQMGTKVTITAVTSIFLSFFFFLGCIWMCRSCEVLCWSVENLRGSREAEPSAEDPAPSAPSLPQSSSDKDLPPSYATLFPNSLPR